jgi:ATP-dependent DNA ligase
VGRVSLSRLPRKRKVELQSKSCGMLTRYFPDLVHVLLGLDAPNFVLDGKIVVPQTAPSRSMRCCSASTRR